MADSSDDDFEDCSHDDEETATASPSCQPPPRDIVSDIVQTTKHITMPLFDMLAPLCNILGLLTEPLEGLAALKTGFKPVQSTRPPFEHCMPGLDELIWGTTGRFSLIGGAMSDQNGHRLSTNDSTH